jgi:hypothetical protein
MTDFSTDPRGDPGAILRLHARYDGEVPKPAREAANAGGTTRLAALRAEARRLMFDGLARDALRALAARRVRLGDGAPANDPNLNALARNLRFYRDRGVARV